MSKNLYVAAIEEGSGKSLAVLGIMELLSKNITNIGFFRPIVRSRTFFDPHVRLISERFNLKLDYEEMFGVSSEETHEFFVSGQLDEIQKIILEKYKALEKKCDFVVCEGTDFTGHSATFEFDLNAQIANNLGCPILTVVNGHAKTNEAVLEGVLLAGETFLQTGCSLVATIVNRASTKKIGDLLKLLRNKTREPIYVVPEATGLSRPTVLEIEKALGAKRIYGRDEDLNREVTTTKVAAMNVHNFLTYVEEGSLVITPADRSDVILGCYLSFMSKDYPRIAGLLLSGNVDTPEPVKKLIAGLDRVPISALKVETDTFSTAMAVNSVRTYLTPENERRNALALAMFEKHVDIAQLKELIDIRRSVAVTPLMFEYQLIDRCKSDKQHIVLPEGTEDRILKAAEILALREVVDITLLGDEEEIREKIAALNLNLPNAAIVDPVKSAWRKDFATTYFELRKHKGISEQMACDVMTDVSYFGTMMVYKGYADGMVSGAVHTTQHTIRPALEFIKTWEGAIVSSVFFMCLADRVLVYADCAVNPNPDVEQLADIAIQSAETARMFGIEPRIAMMSYSTGESGKGEDVEKVRQATKLARERRPDMMIDGPLQYDAAVDQSVAKTKLPESKVAGQATVLIFPDLNTGNNTYKAVQRSANAVAIGPVLQGLRKPVNDLSRGSTVADIVNTACITAIQAQAIKSQRVKPPVPATAEFVCSETA